MSELLPLFVAIPILLAGLIAPFRTEPRLNAIVLLITLAASTLAGAALIAATADGETLAHGVAGFPFGIAIPFAADMFTALMLTVTGILSIACCAFALATPTGKQPFFAPLVLVLTAGVNGALLTADLFNLFVFIEVMLLPSYGLLVMSAKGEARLTRINAVRLYVTVNLLTSTVFLAGVAFVYGITGTVNLAELAGAAKESTAVGVATAVCLFALAIKASVVPVHGWLARTYPATSPAVTALFSGLHTKVAIYAIFRIYAIMFDGDDRYLWIGITLFSLTMVIGVLGAVGETTTRSILAFHMVSQIGYILLGVALFGLLGLTAGIFYLIHHMIVKASLFLSTGAIEEHYGSGTLGKVTGMAKREPLLAAAFFAAALSLAGLPPFSGFVAKLAIITAAVDAGQVIVVVLAILVSLVTLLSMLKIWSGVFWGPSHEDPPAPPAAESSAHAVAVATRAAVRTHVPLRLALPAVALAVVTLGLGLGAEFLLGFAETAASNLVDTSTWTQAVSAS